MFKIGDKVRYTGTMQNSRGDLYDITGTIIDYGENWASSTPKGRRWAIRWADGRETSNIREGNLVHATPPHRAW